MSKWKFPRDTAFRKQFFVPDSFAHPAKMDSQLLIKIVETYTKVGETILDPMAGSGTTMLACTLGRNCILVELEEKFCKMMEANWKQVRMKPQLGSTMGNCQIIQGDSRNLKGLLADKIITSPPYADQPQPSRTNHGILNHKPDCKCNFCRKNRGNKGAIQGYRQADKIITSPPYENALHDDYEARQNWAKTKHDGQRETNPTGYSQNTNNIGNLKSDSYLQAMLQIYQQCYKVLRDKGLMILVVKNFIRDKKEVDLRADTVKLCEQAGFRFKEEHHRILPAQSFWRVIALQKCDYRTGPKENQKCKLGLQCPIKESEEEQLVLSGEFKTEKEFRQHLEQLCPQYINTVPEIDREYVLIFDKLRV